MAKLSYELIIFLVILGCVVAVLIAYSLHYVFTNGFYNEEDSKEMPEDQRRYMHAIRIENRKRLAHEARQGMLLPQHERYGS